MATKVNPAPETSGTVDSASGESPQAASAGKVRVRWKGGHNTGYRSRRVIDGNSWYDTGYGAQPDGNDQTVQEVDAEWWNALTPAQRKAEQLEEVS